MKKLLIFAAAIAVAVLGFNPERPQTPIESAQAVTLGDVLGDSTYDAVEDTGEQVFRITDTDGIYDDVDLYLRVEFAAYAGQNSSFLYDLADPTNRVTIFDGADAVGTSQSLVNNHLNRTPSFSKNSRGVK